MMQRKIIVLDSFDEKHLLLISDAVGKDFFIEKLSFDCSDDIKKEALKDAEIIIGQPDIKLLLNKEVNCPKLKFIQMTWAGADIYTQSEIPFPKDSVILANASGTYGMIISQFVIAQILSLMLNFKEYHFQQENKIWQRRGPIKSLDHAKVIIFGSGDIGTFTAKRLSGFDAYTIGVCRDISKSRPYFNELCTLENAEKYFCDVDVVVCCMPNTKETAGYFDSRRLGLLKDGSIIVNVGRGNFIDCMALNGYLDNGHLWGAALDVTYPEPLPQNHPLWNNPKCVITPHTSGVAFGHLEKTVELLLEIVCENLKHYKNHEAIKNRVF